MVDTFSTDAEMRGLADIRHDLLPISSQPPYSLLLGGCDEIGNKSPLAVRAACSQSLLLAMSWHSSVSDVLSPYPPQPSPPLGEERESKRKQCATFISQFLPTIFSKPFWRSVIATSPCRVVRR